MNQKYWTSLGLKVLEVSASAGISYSITQVADMSGQWVPLLTVGLQVVQGLLARKIGDPESASYK